jgi:hypothetical protein
MIKLTKTSMLFSPIFTLPYFTLIATSTPPLLPQQERGLGGEGQPAA